MTASALLPFLVFTLLVLAAFGVGDLIWRRTAGAFAGESILAEAIFAETLGLAAIGNTLFVAGVAGTAYRPSIIWPMLIAGAGFGSFRLIRTARFVRLPSWRGVSIWQIFVLSLVAVYSVRWLRILKGFTAGDDVFGHHYAHAKYMARIGRYGHEITLPWGLDIVSNYNASLSHTLYVVGHLLADERSSNLLHWLTQLLLIGSIYVLGRALSSREGGLMAIGIYLGAGLLGHEPVSVQDYSITAALTVLIAYSIVMLRRSGDWAWLKLAAIFGGFVASSKNYGIPILIPLSILIVLWARGPLVRRLRAAVTFTTIAFLIYSPWFFYNLVTMGDPWFPFLRSAEMGDILRVTERVDMLVPFVIPGHSGSSVPRLCYFLSLFIPFEPRYVVFGIGAIPLIALPVSLLYVIWRRTESLKEANALFVASAAMFAALFAAIGRVAFYKWAVFPFVIYTVSLSAIATRWANVSRHCAWAFTIAVAVLNYWYIGSPMLKDYVSQPTQRDRWDEVTTFLNDHLEPGAIVAGTNATTSYYLRSDLGSLRGSDGLATNWSREEEILRKMHASYFVTYPNARQQAAEWYLSLIAAATALDGGDPRAAKFLAGVLERNSVRFEQRDAFLAGHGILVREFNGGIRLYRLAFFGK